MILEAGAGQPDRGPLLNDSSRDCISQYGVAAGACLPSRRALTTFTAASIAARYGREPELTRRTPSSPSSATVIVGWASTLTGSPIPAVMVWMSAGTTRP